jgi:hypothetical protein
VVHVIIALLYKQANQALQSIPTPQHCQSFK